MTRPGSLAVGINRDGRRGSLAIEMANREIRSGRQDGLISLKARGLRHQSQLPLKRR